MNKVRVEKIHGTSNPDIFRLECRQETQKTAVDGNLGYWLKGVIDTTEQRVAFQSVSTQFIDEMGITEGAILEDCTGVPIKIVIKETFNGRKWITKDGVPGEQSPKINPKTSEVLTKDGKPIYRNMELTTDMDELDVYIKHDTANAGQTVAASAAESQDIPF